jgi:hypothetical protein
MAEPPILPNDDRAHDGSDPVTTEHAEANNPFAPSTHIPAPVDVARTDLTVSYWITVVSISILAGGLGVSGYPIAWSGLLVLLAAAIRVPLIQRRQSIANPQRNLPNAAGMLVASLAFVIVFLLTACIAFVVICVPVTIVAGEFNDDTSIYLVSGLSGVAALVLFGFLYVVSLRLPI